MLYKPIVFASAAVHVQVTCDPFDGLKVAGEVNFDPYYGKCLPDGEI